jgi:hypothetical protein
MSETTADRVCPPHHWEVTIVRADGTAHHHHVCLRCQAQKDVPLSAATQAPVWRMGKSAPAREQS